jgi:hypothetical protein
VEQVTAATLSVLLLLAPDAEDASYREIARLFGAEAPEPEPPAGLRAPEKSERYERARAKYEELLREWRAREGARRASVVEACDRYLLAYPEGGHRAHVLYIRGATRFRSGEHAAARADLEAYLASKPTGATAEAASAAVVESCRALGDFSAALRYGGPDPFLLEEAGEIERAIAAAREAGREVLAARWALIGKPFPGPIHIPEGAAAVIVLAGRELPKGFETSLKERFSAEKGKVAFLSAAGPYPAGLSLLDAQGVVRAADPRLDTVEIRVRRLTRRG